MEAESQKLLELIRAMATQALLLPPEAREEWLRGNRNDTYEKAITAKMSPTQAQSLADKVDQCVCEFIDIIESSDGAA